MRCQEPYRHPFRSSQSQSKLPRSEAELWQGIGGVSGVLFVFVISYASISCVVCGCELVGEGLRFPWWLEIWNQLPDPLRMAYMAQPLIVINEFAQLSSLMYLYTVLASTWLLLPFLALAFLKEPVSFGISSGISCSLR